MTRCANCRNDKGIHDAMMETTIEGGATFEKVVKVCEPCRKVVYGEEEGEKHPNIFPKLPRE